jgi:hypothetical protein
VVASGASGQLTLRPLVSRGRTRALRSPVAMRRDMLCRIDDGTQPTTRLQCFADARQGLLLIGEVDEADARNRRIEAARRYIEIFAIQDQRANVLMAFTEGILLAKLQDFRRNIGRHHQAIGTDAFGGMQVRSPAPAATSRTWLPGLTSAMSSMSSVAGPNH